MNKRTVVLLGATSLGILLLTGPRIFAPMEPDASRKTENAPEHPAAETLVTKVCKRESTVSLAGSVPNEHAKLALKQQAADLFRNRDIEVNFHTQANMHETVDEVLTSAITELGQLENGCVTLREQEMLIAGSIRSASSYRELQLRLSKLEANGVRIRYELTLPKLSERTLRCLDESNQLVSRDETALFKFNSVDIHEIGRQKLGGIVEVFQRCPDAVLIVTGHTDRADSSDMDLGLLRANAVVEFLTAKGIDDARLRAVSLGFSQPIADSATEAGRAANRRIEFRALAIGANSDE